MEIKRLDIIKRITREKIPLVLIGGQAVNFHGYPRETTDVDFATRIIDVDKIIDIMYEFGFKLPRQSGKTPKEVRWIESSSEAKNFAEKHKLGSLNFYLLSEDYEEVIDNIDFIFDNPVPFARLYSDGIPLKGDVPIKVSSIEHLILMKEKSLKKREDRIRGEVDKMDVVILRELLKRKEGEKKEKS